MTFDKKLLEALKKDLKHSEYESAQDFRLLCQNEGLPIGMGFALAYRLGIKDGKTHYRKMISDAYRKVNQYANESVSDLIIRALKRIHDHPEEWTNETRLMISGANLDMADMLLNLCEEEYPKDMPVPVIIDEYSHTPGDNEEVNENE